MYVCETNQSVTGFLANVFNKLNGINEQTVKYPSGVAESLYPLSVFLIFLKGAIIFLCIQHQSVYTYCKIYLEPLLIVPTTYYLLFIV